MASHIGAWVGFQSGDAPQWVERANRGAPYEVLPFLERQLTAHGVAGIGQFFEGLEIVGGALSRLAGVYAETAEQWFEAFEAVEWDDGLGLRATVGIDVPRPELAYLIDGDAGAIHLFRSGPSAADGALGVLLRRAIVADDDRPSPPALCFRPRLPFGLIHVATCPIADRTLLGLLSHLSAGGEGVVDDERFWEQAVVRAVADPLCGNRLLMPPGEAALSFLERKASGEVASTTADRLVDVIALRALDAGAWTSELNDVDLEHAYHLLRSSGRGRDLVALLRHGSSNRVIDWLLNDETPSPEVIRAMAEKIPERLVATWLTSTEDPWTRNALAMRPDLSQESLKKMYDVGDPKICNHIIRRADCPPEVQLDLLREDSDPMLRHLAACMTRDHEVQRRFAAFDDVAVRGGLLGNSHLAADVKARILTED